jgi:hypothetical protein
MLNSRSIVKFLVVFGLSIGASASALAATTAVKEETFKFTLAPGATSKAITPPANVPVQVMGIQTAVGDRGVGHITLLRTPSSLPPAFLEWQGYDIYSNTVNSPALSTGGFSSTAGTHMIYLDFSGYVELIVASAESFAVRNNGYQTITVQVTEMW